MPRTTPLAGALLGVLLLSGCATPGSTPKGSLRDAASLHAASSLADARLSAAAWPDARWWSAFGDPQLDALVDEALAGAPSIAAADARTREAQA